MKLLYRMIGRPTEVGLALLWAQRQNFDIDYLISEFVLCASYLITLSTASECYTPYFEYVVSTCSKFGMIGLQLLRVRNRRKYHMCIIIHGQL